MKKIVLLLLMCILFVIPVYGAEKFESVEPDIGCQLAAGKIWMNRHPRGHDHIDVKNNVIFVRGYFTNEEKKVIQEMAPNYEVAFLDRAVDGNGYLEGFPYSFTAGSKYVASRGMLFEMEHAPYLDDGILMMPWRDFVNLYKKVTLRKFETQWIEEEQKIVYNDENKGSTYKALLVKENMLYRITTPNQEEYIPLIGKIEIKDGVAYIPFERNNAQNILWSSSFVVGWDAETNTLTISM